MEVIERYKIITDDWSDLGYYLGMGQVNGQWQTYMYLRDKEHNILNRTGWIDVEHYETYSSYSIKRIWFLRGERVPAGEVWGQLPADEMAETLWDLDQWK